jgi:hypothetical protein
MIEEKYLNLSNEIINNLILLLQNNFKNLNIVNKIFEIFKILFENNYQNFNFLKKFLILFIDFNLIFENIDEKNILFGVNFNFLIIF